jgi:hypothetical protein
LNKYTKQNIEKHQKTTKKIQNRCKTIKTYFKASKHGKPVSNKPTLENAAKQIDQTYQKKQKKLKKQH